MQAIQAVIEAVYNFLWGDLVRIPLPGGSSLGLSLLVLILVPAGVYFTVRTRFLPFRLFPEMMRVTLENNKQGDGEGHISGVQALIVSTACRVGMGNLVGVVAAISAGGAGAVFWMWIIALLGSSTAFIEATLAQLYKEKDPLYGGYRGGPAYYLHHLFVKEGSGRRRSVMASLFALSGLICWCGISQVTANSISSSFENAFHIPPLWSTVALVALAAVIVLRKHATVKVLDLIVPVMAACYFFITLFIILRNAGQLPAVFGRIFAEAFGLRQAVAGGIGAVIMNGAKRGLFSNEAGSGSAPCAAGRRRHRPPRQGGPAAGAGGVHRHSGHLQLLGHDHAADPREPDRRPGRDGPFAGRHAVPPGRVRGSVHRGDLVAVQFFPPSWASCFTPGPMWPTCSGTTG